MSLFQAAELYMDHYPVKHHQTLDHFTMASIHGDDTIRVEMSFEGTGDAGGTQQALFTKAGLLGDSFGAPISKGLLTHRALSIMTVINARHGKQVYGAAEFGDLVASLRFQWDLKRQSHLSNVVISKVVRTLLMTPEISQRWTWDEVLEIIHGVHREMVTQIGNDYPVSVLLVGFNPDTNEIAPPIKR